MMGLIANLVLAALSVLYFIAAAMCPDNRPMREASFILVSTLFLIAALKL